MVRKFQFRRGLKKNLPVLSPAEIAYTTDEKSIYMGDGSQNIRLLDQKDKTEIDSALVRKVNKGEIGVSDIDKTKGKLDQTYMTEEFLQQMVGNTPINAIPADRSLTTNKFVEKAITPAITSFAKTKNLFNGSFIKGILSGGNPFTLSASATGICVINKVAPNTTYTVSKPKTTDRFRIGIFKTEPSVGSQTTTGFIDDTGTSITVTTNSDENFLVIYVSSEAQGLTPEWLQIEEGSKATEYTSPKKVIIDLDKDSIPPLGVEKINFAKRSKNLFDGTFIQGKYVGGTGAIESDNPLTRMTNKIPCKPNAYYTVSGGDRNRFRFEDASGNFLALNLNSVALAPANAAFMIIYYSSDSSHTKVQIEEGKGSTPYEPPYVLKDEMVGLSKVKNEDITHNYIIIDNVKDIYTSHSQQYTVSQLGNDVNNLYAIYDKLVTDYPDYVTRTLLTNESTGLPIYRYDFKPKTVQGANVIKIPKLLYVSGIHGQEKWCMIDGARFFVDLATNWKTNDVLRMLRWNVHLVVIPSLNPYGFNHNQRKNGNGVDINRNYPLGWTPNTDKTSVYYPGTAPLTEKESQLMDSLLEQNKDFMFAIDHHNYTIYPTQISHIVWSDTLNENTKKVMLGTLNQMNAKLKTDYPSLPQDASNLMAFTPQKIEGLHYQHFFSKGIPGIILETVIDFGGTEEQLHQFGTDVVGNIILNAVRYHKEIR